MWRKISREALAEVRNAIGGYRAGGLEEEFVRAVSTSEDSGCGRGMPEGAPVPLSPAQETVLALAVRESVTNVVRHARAGRCQVRLEQADGHCKLEIQDDGRGG